MRIFLAVEPADFRKGKGGLASLCRAVLKCDPFSGAIFVFRNRARKAMEILVYDSKGSRLCTKRLPPGGCPGCPWNLDEKRRLG
ncbi:MAG: IS66 family insertion sequence element accessory protein TnpB [Planctomycetota bacterium]